MEPIEELTLVGKVHGKDLFALKNPKQRGSQSMDDLKIERLDLHLATMDSRLAEFSRIVEYIAQGGKVLGLGLFRLSLPQKLKHLAPTDDKLTELVGEFVGRLEEKQPINYESLCPENPTQAAFWACFDRQSCLDLFALELRWKKEKLKPEEVQSIVPQSWLSAPNMRGQFLSDDTYRSRELPWEKRAIEALVKPGVDFDFKPRPEMSSLGVLAQSLFLIPKYREAMRTTNSPQVDQFNDVLDAFSAIHERWILSKSLSEPSAHSTKRQSGMRI